MRDSLILSIIPEKVARKYNVIPIELKDDILTVGACQDDLYIVQNLKLLTKKKICIKKYTKEKIIQQIESIYGNQVEDDEDYAKKIFLKVIEKAVIENASDIHIEPFSDSMKIRFRVDGELYEAFKYVLEFHSSFTTVVKLKAGMDITEKRLPQDGRGDIEVCGKLIDIRVSTIPTIYGEKIVIRILNRDNFFKSKAEIGFSKEAVSLIDSMISKKTGIILITGETGSGKTTTLYSILNDLNNVNSNVITLEDPVEYKMDGINQIQVNEKIGLTFEKGLRSILRQDPDVIMLGEVRDSETAKIAIRSSITGHLVLSTLHTNDAISSIVRLNDMGVDLYLISASLLGIISQKLVKKVCPMCRGENIPCDYCENKRFLGRTIVYEILQVDDEIRECINDIDKWSRIREIALKNDRMITFEETYKNLIDSNLIKSF